MALTAAIIGSAVIGAGAGMYGASQGSKAQAAGNRNNAYAIAENRRVNTANALQDAINSYSNARQLALDNQRYEEAKVLEEKQRQLTNALATASQVDADGNSMSYDRATNTWRASDGPISRDRRATLGALAYDQQLEGATTGAQQARDRRNQGAELQGTQRALSQELLARYRNNQGRDPGQMEGALIEKNVAEATDPLYTGGNMAMLAGYRQGNSGNDALMGSLARQSQGGTRSAIANARFAAPNESFNEREAASTSILGPASTLAERGSSGPGMAAPTYGGSASNNLMASLQRNNPAGVGSPLNPRSGGMLSVKQAPGAMGSFTPLNANGNGWAAAGQSVSNLLKNEELLKMFRGSGSGWKEGGYGGLNAPVGYGTGTMPDRGFQAGDYPNVW